MEEIIRRFVVWTKLKIKIHFDEKKRYPKERQIWWVSLGQNIGVEINGKNEKFERPAVIVREYNQESFLILPLSSKPKKGFYYFNFIDDAGRYNVANLSQSRSVSSKRLIRKMGQVNVIDFERLKTRLKNMF